MQIDEKTLFEKFSKLANSVKQEFRKKGLVIPTKLPNGNILIGTYIIKKINHVFYIYDKNGSQIIGPLNLVQTAVIVANDLELGKWPDHTLLNNDTWYGYKSFEEQVALHKAENALKKKDLDTASFSKYKAAVAVSQKQSYRKNIDLRYSKLCKIT